MITRTDWWSVPRARSDLVLAVLAVLWVLVSACSKDTKDNRDNNDAGDTDTDTDTDTDADTDCVCDSTDDSYCEDACVMVSCDGCHFSSHDCCAEDIEFHCDPEHFPECGANGDDCWEGPECLGEWDDHCYDDFTLIDCEYAPDNPCLYWLDEVDCYDPEGCPCGSGCAEEGEGPGACWCCTDAGVDGGG